jgi:hypothetical protein
MMDTIDLTICIYFNMDADILPLRNIVELTRKWSMYVNKEIEYLSYTEINDKRKHLHKKVKFNEKNLEIMYQVEKNKKLKNAELFNLSANAYLQSRDTDLSMLFSHPMDIFNLYTIKFGFNTDVLNIKNNNQLFATMEELFNLLSDINAIVKYGIVFPMERVKFPAFYASGISSQELTKEEKYKSFLWGNYGIQCAEKIWNVFWGNILTTKHLASDKIIREVKYIVGEDNVKKVNENVFIVSYPLSIFNYAKEKYNFDEYYLKLTKVFEKYNLMITE